MGKKGKKGNKLGDIGKKMHMEDEYVSLSLQIETLERELQVKSAASEEAVRSEIELRSKVDQMEEDFRKEQDTTFAVTADMARQYKALQEELIYKINSLETQYTEQKEELDITNHELTEMIRDKDDDIQHKDEQISQLNERMNDMSAEFASMLGETLELLKHNITEKLSDASGEEAGKADFQQRLQDYSARAFHAVSIGATNPALGGSTSKALPDKGGELATSSA
jgi:ABC-type transporter Mla subunit MlaD